MAAQCTASPDEAVGTTRAIYNVLSERMLAFLKEAAMNIDQIPEAPAMRLFRLEAFSEGKAEGKAEAVLAVLAARGLPIRDDQRQLLLRCGDLGILDRYLRLVASVSSVEELFTSSS